MQLLLKQTRIIDPTSAFHGQVKDVLIVDGRIETIRNSIASVGQIVKGTDLCISPGWLDFGSHVGDPGLEHLETFSSAAAAAAKGGFTTLVVLPNTQPALHSKSEIEYVNKNSQLYITTFYALGAISRDCAGKDIAEMLDMHQAGAVAFTDGLRPLQSTGLMMRALEYVRMFNGLIVNTPDQSDLTLNGQIHEGTLSTSLGLRGVPPLQETLMLKRDIDLLRYANSRLHVLNISTEASLSLIMAAKQEGLDISCSVAALQLEATQDQIGCFDTNYKVWPPLRTENDRQSLIRGVRDGHIDFVTANHRPVDPEGKMVEFDQAQFGVSSLETTYSTLVKAWGKSRSQTSLIEALAIRNRRVLGLEIPTIEKGRTADLTVFSPSMNTTYVRETFASACQNNPFIDQELPGRVLGIVHKGQSTL